MTSVKTSSKSNVSKKKKVEKKRGEKLKYIFAAIILALTLYPVWYLFRSKNVPSDDLKLRYWPILPIFKWNPNGSLRTMNRAFEKLNFRFVNASHGDEWDIAWSIDMPFFGGTQEGDEIFAGLRHIQFERHQKFNHFPGNGILITKSTMATHNHNSKYILPSFEVPDMLDELHEFIKNNPDKTILEKNTSNRGVKIIKADQIKVAFEDEVFYQQFMDKPFTIDGHAFDFGVFAVITSVDPLRVYRYGDALLRFCEEEYYPFDATNRNKYVVKDGSIPPYEMPSFKKIYEKYQFSVTSIFERLIEKKGFNVNKFWAMIDDAIASIVMNSENYILRKVSIILD
jgi:tubulin monoglycylase TTLL15